MRKIIFPLFVARLPSVLADVRFREMIKPAFPIIFVPLSERKAKATPTRVLPRPSA